MAAARECVPADFVEFRNLRLVPQSLMVPALSRANYIGLVITGAMEVTDSSGTVQYVALTGERAVLESGRSQEMPAASG